MHISGTETCLAVKTHRFPFQFKLPTKLPASFEGEFGYIRYTIRVVIEIPLQTNKELIKDITILKMIDSNDSQLEVNRLDPFEKQRIIFLNLQRKVSIMEKFNPYFVLSCFPWYPLTIDAHVEPGTYAPGTIIDLGINVTNKSFRRVRNFKVQLIKVNNFLCSFNVGLHLK